MPTYAQGVQGYVIDGYPVKQELKLKTVSTAHSKDGRLVVRNTDDSHVVICGDNAINCLGFISPRGSHDTDSDYAAEDEMTITRGPVITTLTLITGQTIVKGDKLSPAANGMLKAAGATPDVSKVVAVAEESVTTGTLASLPIVVRWVL